MVLTNYSNDKKTFYLSIYNSFDIEEGLEGINFYTTDRKRATFELDGNETTTFIINLNDYETISGLTYSSSGSTNSSIYEIVLTDEKGNRVLLEHRNFFGIELNE